MKTLAAAAAAMLLTACGAASHATETASGTAAHIKATVPQVTKTITLTAATDGNHLLGRPNGYTAAVVLVDSRAHCQDGPGVACGAVVEQWPDTDAATAREHYIQAMLKAAPMLGTEYDTVHGNLLLRVTGALTPAQAQAYAAALAGS